ncbi:hypothetical protein Airi01_088660 [Actinoallomurus iriomotensis]|uniref:Uncharacterized protein n=1 Tax=Actinoallomurus iriomotensis TaxID=478107 RepID=A0A9W6RRP4_9ACTN|nr:hypothetical protein Airi01_088660 [Actinoallomurus iriomotensis]
MSEREGDPRDDFGPGTPVGFAIAQKQSMSDPLARKGRGNVGITPTLVPVQSGRELTGHELSALTRHVSDRPRSPSANIAACRPTAPADKIMTSEHPPSTHGPQTVPKRTLGTPDSVENAQLSTGAPPGT